MSDGRVRGEASIIAEFMAPLAAGDPGALGLQDDCAVLAPSPGCELVLKTDAIAEGVHFLPDDAPEDIGWKALAVNVSDLAAKAARPRGYLLSLAFPQAPERGWLAGFARGLQQAQTAFGMHLLGGDTDRRPGPVSITPFVIGEVPAGRMVRRGTAKAGDLVVVSGTLGDAAVGLRLRSVPELAVRWRLDDAAASALRSRYLRPTPRLALSAALRGYARAAMDVSDGLVKDLSRMCTASGVGARVEIAALPVSDAFAAVRAADPAAAEAAIVAGDDYEVLAAVPPETWPAFRDLSAAAGVAVAAIGRFHDDPDVAVVDPSGRVLPLAETGWDHF